MTPTAHLPSADADEEHPAGPAAEAGPFVLNLCSSTTPMALAQTELPELKRFTFFVSRRFEEGRERFRLHMGYFATQAEAEEWLGVVRDIYPGAWAGEAPGKKLRARAAEAVAAQAQHAAGPQRSAAPPAQALAPPPARRAGAQPAAPMLSRVPTLHPPAPAQRTAPPRAAPAPAAPRQAAPPSARPQQPRSANLAATSQHAVGRPAPPTPPTAPPMTRPASARSAPAAAAARPAPQAPRTQQPAKRPLFSDSNVKEVMAALDAPGGADNLSDTQVLRLLEHRREEGAGAVDPAAESGISLLKPEDTGTRRALKDALSRNQPVSFAVQLQWSAQPVALDKVPPLAIFSAYTLYSVEGSRDGRRWYGLRLGFFNDAISAKQVAYYVRSEFASVAVVPVSAQERKRASDDQQRFAAGTGSAKKRAESEDDEFKLIDSDEEAAPLAAAGTARSAGTPSPAPQRSAPAAAASRSVPTRAARKAAAKVGARERRTPQTLEETLEILGANELAIDNASDSGVRHLRVEVQKDNPFSRLIERLSERVKKS